jgi:hypothetical protein
MQKLEERVLMASWKSYKVFQPSGAIKRHNPSHYQEFHFSGDGALTIKEYKKGLAENVFTTRQWVLDFRDKKHFLKIPQKKVTFEIITVNHTVMVLLENPSGEKIFFCKEDYWTDYLDSNKEVTL